MALAMLFLKLHDKFVFLQESQTLPMETHIRTHHKYSSTFISKCLQTKLVNALFIHKFVKALNIIKPVYLFR